MSEPENFRQLPTPSLDEFVARYARDDNEWWRIDCGHHQNLFEAATDRLEALSGIIDAAHGRTQELEPQMAHFDTCWQLHYTCLVRKLHAVLHDTEREE